MSSCRRSAVPATKPRMGLGFHRLASRLREIEDGEAPEPWRRAVALGVARERVAGQRSGHEAARRNETGWSVSINGGALDYSPWEPVHTALTTFGNATATHQNTNSSSHCSLKKGKETKFYRALNVYTERNQPN